MFVADSYRVLVSSVLPAVCMTTNEERRGKRHTDHILQTRIGLNRFAVITSPSLEPLGRVCQLLILFTELV